MDWVTWVAIGGVVVAFLLFKRLSFVGADAARRFLAAGAKIVDVRTEAEFAQGAVRGAVNVPLNRLRDDIERQAPDKHQPLLVHCLSGGRSGVAKHVLRGMGYTRVYNLGSLARARKIVED